MAKQSGLGDGLLVGGYNVSGDIGALDSIACPRTTGDVTGIDKGAYERIYLLGDGQIDYTAFFNPTGVHPVLSVLPRTSTIVSYLRSTVLGAPSSCLVAKQIGYDGSRGQDGSLTFKISSQAADGYPLEWGRQATAGVRTDTGATNGTAIDDGAASSHGLSAYLHVTAFTGTDATVKIQESSDSGAGDAWADVTGGAFTQITAGPTFQRIATATNLAVERYLRVATVTTGGFTSLAFQVTICRTPAPGTVT